MAATTLKAIIDRFQAVLEAAPLSLTLTETPFTFDAQPNTTVVDRYWVEDGGLTETESQSNNVDARMDTLIVWIGTPQDFDGHTQAEALETRLNTVERYIRADEQANDYHATMTGRTVQPIKETDVLIASAEFVVDYDYTLSTS